MVCANIPAPSLANAADTKIGRKAVGRKKTFTVSASTDTPKASTPLPKPPTRKLRQMSIVSSEKRERHARWVSMHQQTCQAGREFSRIGRLALLSEVLDFHRRQADACKPHRRFTKLFVQGLTHDVNLLLHASQPKDFSKMAAECISDLFLFHHTAPKRVDKIVREEEWYASVDPSQLRSQ